MTKTAMFLIGIIVGMLLLGIVIIKDGGERERKYQKAIASLKPDYGMEKLQLQFLIKEAQEVLEKEEILLQINNTKRWLKYLKDLLKTIKDRERDNDGLNRKSS